MSPLKVKIEGLKPKTVADGDALEIGGIIPTPRAYCQADGLYGQIKVSPNELMEVTKDQPIKTGTFYGRRTLRDEPLTRKPYNITIQLV